MKFNLDTPSDSRLTGLTRFSGWYLARGEKPNLILEIEGEPHGSLLYGSRREDVARAFPNEPAAMDSGFFGDILLPPRNTTGDKVTVDIRDLRQENLTLFHSEFTVETTGEAPHRNRAYSLKSITACPSCRSGLDFDEIHFHCTRCGYGGHVRAGGLHFLNPGEFPFLRLSERGTTHPYGRQAQELIHKAGDGLVLDFGAGNSPPELVRARTCYLDIQQYPNTDIICTTANLPFRDEVFDAVVSQNVFEHVPDPFHVASELYRVLKPGGMIYVDTAFMQPLHADPNHYFNMTRHGLRQVMSAFEEVDSGVANHHRPSWGWLMQLEAVLPYMTEGAWKQRLTTIKDLLTGNKEDFDQALGPAGIEKLAAGVFFEGRKPTRRRSAPPAAN